MLEGLIIYGVFSAIYTTYLYRKTVRAGDYVPASRFSMTLALLLCVLFLPIILSANVLKTASGLSNKA